MNEQKASGGIEWTAYRGRPAWTWNPVVGCSHQCQWDMPGGTVICYAKRQAESPRLAKFYPKGFAAHYFYSERLKELREAKEPSGIFVSSMGDLFGGQVDMEQIARVVQAMREYPQHVFFILTKNPRRMAKYVNDNAGTPLAMPHNALLGVSMPPDRFNGHPLDYATKRNWMQAALWHLYILKTRRGYTTWMSFEPLSWNVAPVLREFHGALSWAVVGAASGADPQNSNKTITYAPDRDYLTALNAMLDQQRVPIFYKGNVRSFALGWGMPVREEFPESP